MRKIKILAEYLNVPESSITVKNEDNVTYYVYNDNDSYRILTEEELSLDIEKLTHDTAFELNEYIQNELSEDPFYNFVDITINYKKISNMIKNDFADYIGNGTYEKFQNNYIFLM